MPSMVVRPVTPANYLETLLLSPARAIPGRMLPMALMINAMVRKVVSFLSRAIATQTQTLGILVMRTTAPTWSRWGKSAGTALKVYGVCCCEVWGVTLNAKSGDHC